MSARDDALASLRWLDKASRKKDGIRVEQAQAQIAVAQVYATLALADAIDALRAEQ